MRRVKKLRTTIPDPDGKRAGDLLNRDFTVAAPNRVWVTDFTYVRTWAGFVYVAFVLDVFAQRIVGWHASTSKKVDLVMTPLRMALWQRDRDGHPVEHGELIHHSDAGSQYTSDPPERADPRFSRASPHRSDPVLGDAYDNALMETVNRPVQDRMHPHDHLPRRPLPDPRRRRVRDRRLGSTGTATAVSTAHSGCSPQ